MKKFLLGSVVTASAAFLLTSPVAVPAKQAPKVVCNPSLDLTVGATSIRLSGDCFTPGSYVGVTENFRSNDGTSSRSSRPNLVNGRIGTGDDNFVYKVDASGSVRLSQGLFLIRSGGPGRLVFVMSSTAGEVADNVKDI